MLLCLASSQSLCLALPLPDSLQRSPYSEELGEEKEVPQSNEDASLLPAFLTTSGGAAMAQSRDGVCRDVFCKRTECGGSFKLGSVSFLASGTVLAWFLVKACF